MKRWMLRIGGIALLLGLGGFLVAASGIISIKASSGHWPITEWFLRFAMKRSIATHSLPIKAPDLSDPALVLKGAGHYETGCRSCHGAPGAFPPRIAQSMLPRPPDLPQRIRESDPEKLFYVVKHGMKFTGMPAWPAPQRDDEVWAVVAFLLQLPGLDESGYRRLVDPPSAGTAPLQDLAPNPEIPSAVLQSCARCHGRDGLGRGSSAFPRLAGQRAEYLHNALQAYALGRRHSGIMGPLAAGLGDAMTREITRYYAGLASPTSDAPTASPTDAAALARGREIAHRGIPGQRVPSCIDCHGAEGRRAKPAYPLLAGQPADYLELQLHLFRDEQRGGSEYAHLMRPVASRLTEEQMRDVALYFASLPTPVPDDSTSR